MKDIIIPVSGGKDSQACVALAVEKYGAERCEMIHQNTGFDHSVTYAHLQYMEQRYGVPLTNCQSAKYKTVPDVIVGEKVIPTRWARACTKQLKLRPQFKWLQEHPERSKLLLLLGMRSNESTHRMKNYGKLLNEDLLRLRDINSECPKRSDCAVQLPIVEWSTPAVFTFLRKRGDKINPLYAKGHKRVGCYPCVLAGPRDFTLAARDPEGRANLQRMWQAINVVKQGHPDEDLSGLFEHDIPAILANKEKDPFGLLDNGDSGCSWCNI